MGMMCKVCYCGQLIQLSSLAGKVMLQCLEVVSYEAFLTVVAGFLQ